MESERSEAWYSESAFRLVRKDNRWEVCGSFSTQLIGAIETFEFSGDSDEPEAFKAAVGFIETTTGEEFSFGSSLDEACARYLEASHV